MNQFPVSVVAERLESRQLLSGGSVGAQISPESSVYGHVRALYTFGGTTHALTVTQHGSRPNGGTEYRPVLTPADADGMFQRTDAVALPAYKQAVPNHPSEQPTHKLQPLPDGGALLMMGADSNFAVAYRFDAEGELIDQLPRGGGTYENEPSHRNEIVLLDGSYYTSSEWSDRVDLASLDDFEDFADLDYVDFGVLIHRRLPDGEIDRSFGGGEVNINAILGPKHPRTGPVELLHDPVTGSVTVFGPLQSNADESRRFFAARLLTNGRLDRAFNGGVVLLDAPRAPTSGIRADLSAETFIHDGVLHLVDPHNEARPLTLVGPTGNVWRPAAEGVERFETGGILSDGTIYLTRTDQDRSHRHQFVTTASRATRLMALSELTASRGRPVAGTLDQTFRLWLGHFFVEPSISLGAGPLAVARVQDRVLHLDIGGGDLVLDVDVTGDLVGLGVKLVTLRTTDGSLAEAYMVNDFDAIEIDIVGKGGTLWVVGSGPQLYPETLAIDASRSRGPVTLEYHATLQDVTFVGSRFGDVVNAPVGRIIADLGGGDDVAASAWGWLIGGSGDDMLRDLPRLPTGGPTLTDTWIYGGAGDDVIRVGHGYSLVFGGDGNDAVDLLYGVAEGGAGNDLLIATGPETVRLDGGPGNDTVAGTVDNDELTGGPGDDLLYGGKGHDVIRGDQAGGGPFGSDTMWGGDGDDLMYGHGGGVRSDELYGEGGDDMLYGGDDSDFLAGGPGDDLLYGHGGNDTILGGGGSDYVDSGPGDDRGDQGDGSDTERMFRWGVANYLTADPGYGGEPARKPFSDGFSPWPLLDGVFGSEEDEWSFATGLWARIE